MHRPIYTYTAITRRAHRGPRVTTCCADRRPPPPTRWAGNGRWESEGVGSLARKQITRWSCLIAGCRVDGCAFSDFFFLIRFEVFLMGGSTGWRVVIEDVEILYIFLFESCGFWVVVGLCDCSVECFGDGIFVRLIDWREDWLWCFRSARLSEHVRMGMWRCKYVHVLICCYVMCLILCNTMYK